MKRVIFGVFAHPDDEAFGPSGTLLLESRAGNDVHLITLTLGEAGLNPDNIGDLAAHREQEWRTAGTIIGARSMTYLGYQDGKLNNGDLETVCEKLIDLVSQTIADYPEDIEIELLSIDLNGVTGHIDHIVAARAACCAFYRMKVHDSRFTRLRLVCLPRSQMPEANTDWIYMEAGRSNEEIDEIVDARSMRDDIIAIMRAHHSQRGDGEAHIEKLGDELGLDYFIIKD